MKISIVEDDYLQADALREVLGRAFSNAQIDCISTEERFRSKLGEWEAAKQEKPDLVIMDIMLRWTDPAPNMPDPPEDVAREGFRRAGIRCRELMSTNKATQNVPVILYSVLEKSDLREELDESDLSMSYMPKNSDTSKLLKRIRQLLRTT